MACKLIHQHTHTHTPAGQVLVFEFKNKPGELSKLVGDEVTIVSDQRFTWKGRDKLNARPGVHKFEPGYQLSSYVQLNPPASATSTDLRSDWHLIAVGTSYGFLLYDYVAKHSVVNRCTLNAQDFAIVSGDGAAMSRKKSFRKSLRESFRRLRRGRSQRGQQPPAGGTTVASGTGTASPDQMGAPKQPFGRGATTGVVRTLNTGSPAPNDTAQQAAAAHRNLYSGERQVEPKVELTSIIKCISLTSAVISSNDFKASLWVGTNSGHVLVYAIDLPSGEAQVASVSASPTGNSDQATSDSVQATSSTSSPSNEPSTDVSDVPKTAARLIKEIQLRHKAPIIAIFTSPEAPAVELARHTTTNDHQHQSTSGSSSSAKSTPEKQAGELFNKSEQADRKSLTAESEANEAPSEPQPPALDKSPTKSTSASAKDQLPQARVLICSEEQFKVFNLPQFKPFCKFKLTAHEGLRAKKISITQFMRPAAAAATVAPSASSHKLLVTSSLSASRSSQSFAATQTSPPASPVPSPGNDDDDAQDSAVANGAKSSSSSSKQKQTENNNNSLSALNNNHISGKNQDQKELLNAKFGANVVTSSSSSSADKSLAGQETSFDEQQAAGATFEPYMVCMSNQGDCAIYSVPDLKRQAQIQVCKREDVNGITSAMLTNYGEGYYLKSSSNFLRFSISSQRVLRVLSVV